MRRRLLPALGFLAVFLSLADAQAARAEDGLFFRNKTRETVYIAVRTYTGTAWTIDGWCKVPPNQVVKVRDAIGNRYGYYYAASRARKWTGKFPNWINPSLPFAYGIQKRNGKEEISGNRHGHVSHGFRQFDAGQARSFTLNIAP
jgi:uncharacterized membrane protein